MDTIIILVITTILLEIILRILGHNAYYFPPFSIVSEPVGSLIPHHEMGLALQPGTFHVTMNDSLEYKTNRNPDSTRFTGISEATSILEFHGCSFTYGMGVDTDQAFPFLLQAKTKKHILIRNKAVPGYGNIQGLLSLKKRIKERNEKLPDTIIMFYASFHNERNVLSPYYREHLYYGFMNMDDDVKKRFKNADKVKFPFARIINHELVIKYSSIKQLFKPLPLREYSTISNAFQNMINMNKNNGIDAEEITIRILEEMNHICEDNNIEFIIASIIKDESTQSTLERLRKKGIPTLDMGVDVLNNPKYNNHPYDSHPNELTHRIYSDRLYHYLNPNAIH